MSSDNPLHTTIYASEYSDDVQDILSQLSHTPEMQRLAEIGMHCGCEYTQNPIYRQERYPYTRLIHSEGVAKIVWNFTRDVRQAVAGLLHDIAAPVFSHTIDFMNNDHMTQESTEAKTLAFIENSESIMSVLNKHGISVGDVADYHKYPIADNDTPMLSADRLEYSLGNAYLLFHAEQENIREIYDDLTVAENEYGIPELAFRSTEKASEFSHMAMRNSRFYVADEERFSMQYLAEIMRRALKKGVLSPGDLHTTEREVISKLKSDTETREAWEDYTRVASVSTSPGVLCDRFCVNVQAKKRYIDPPVITPSGVKRASAIDADIKKEIESFLKWDFNYWVYGI